MAKGQYRNVRQSEKFGGPHWWQGEVLTKNEIWRQHDGVWALTQADAERRFAEQAEQYADYVMDPEREARDYEAMMKDMSIWGTH